MRRRRNPSEQPRIPLSEAGELALLAAETDRNSRVIQLEWRPVGQGMVELVYTRGAADFGYATGLILAWPQQGTMVGDPPRDVQNALKLQAATLALNRVLRELCS